MAKKNPFGVKRPGIEKARAKANGITTHQQLVNDSKSSDPTRKKEGVLGLTFQKMAKKRKGK